MSIRQEIAELRSGTTELRKFGWVVGGAFVLLWAVLAHVLTWFGKTGHDVPVLWWIGAALITLGTVLPVVLRPVFYVWMSFAVVMGFVVTRVLLTIFFFVVITPVALFFRLIGRDALRRKVDRSASSHWVEKEYPIDDRTRLEKFF